MAKTHLYLCDAKSKDMTRVTTFILGTLLASLYFIQQKTYDPKITSCSQGSSDSRTGLLSIAHSLATHLWTARCELPCSFEIAFKVLETKPEQWNMARGRSQFHRVPPPCLSIGA